ncbi:MAG: DUF481 domain-containing protein [Myxococcales bacterium]|nr:DUF481 domain-containing protein [Myxococcales bacterium]
MSKPFRPHLDLVVLVAACALAASTAHAQIVNVQSQMKNISDGVSGTAEGGLELKTGSAGMFVINGSVRVAYKFGDNLLFAIVRGDYGKIYRTDPDITIEAKHFEHLRYRRALAKRLTAEAFVQHEADRYRRLTTRALAGAGPRLNLVAHKHVEAFYGLAYMFEFERLADDEEIDAGDTQRNHRLSTYLVASVSDGDALRLSEAIYVQPKLADPADIRVLSELSLKTKITKDVAFKTSFVVAYDSAPPAAINGLDTTLETSIEVAF